MDELQLFKLGHEATRQVFLVWMCAVTFAVLFQAVWVVWKVHALESEVKHLQFLYNKKEETMKKIIFAAILFCAGYLLGTLELPVTAQAPVQGFDSHGNAFIYYPPSGPGGVGQSFGGNGATGQLYAPPAPLQGFRSPC
jgi:hypothetical protein